MLTKFFTSFYLGAISLLISSSAQAHMLGTADSSWLAGFSHPLLGLDHVLAFLAVGLWAAQQGGKRRWQLPGAFSLMLLMGANFGELALPLPHFEVGITLSLLMIGLLIAGAIVLPARFGLSLISIFALFHGYAHGIEILPEFSSLPYSLGFMLSSLLLQVIGIGFAGLAQKLDQPKLLRYSGFAISLTGIWLWN